MFTINGRNNKKAFYISEIFTSSTQKPGQLRVGSNLGAGFEQTYNHQDLSVLLQLKLGHKQPEERDESSKA